MSRSWRSSPYLCSVRVPLVFLSEYVIQGPRLQLGNVPQFSWRRRGRGQAGGGMPELTVLLEELLGILAGEGDVPGDDPDELDDVGEVVLVPGVVLTTVGLKQVVTWAGQSSLL